MNQLMLYVGLKEVYHFELLIKKNLLKKLYQNILDVSILLLFSFNLFLFLLLDTKMTSFQRQLNLYGFRRVTKGEDVGAYYHPKFQKGRRDLIAEIKRLPGKTSSYGNDDKNKILSLPDHRFNPQEGNIVEVIGGNNRPVTMSKLTMKIAGISSNSVSIISPNSTPVPFPTLHLAPAYVAENAVQFVSVPPNNESPRPPATVCLSGEKNTPPLLLRNFSVSSTFDEEYRLPTPNEDEGDNSARITPTVNQVSTTIKTNVVDKPPLPVREESESWVKLGALDQLHDMDPFDIDTVFES